MKEEPGAACDMTARKFRECRHEVDYKVEAECTQCKRHDVCHCKHRMWTCTRTADLAFRVSHLLGSNTRA
jgi:hypothetical protein